MPDKKLFQTDPRSYALALVEEGVSVDTMLTVCLEYLSHDDCREMLDMNELSPRFDESDEDDETTDDEWSHARAMLKKHGRSRAENEALDLARANSGSDREFWMRVYEILDDGWCGECGEPWPCSDFRRKDLPPLATMKHGRA